MAAHLPPPIGTLHAVVIDVADLDRSVEFWTGLLGAGVTFRDDHYARIGGSGQEISVLLQAAPETKSGKNRVHLDFHVADLEPAVQRARDLGATEVRHVAEYGLAWMVMADLDGNEFCLVQTPPPGD